jgi:hypothetical protein
MKVVSWILIWLVGWLVSWLVRLRHTVYWQLNEFDKFGSVHKLIS